MRPRFLLCALALLSCPASLQADKPPPRVLLVTHAGGFIHDSAVVAESVVREMGVKHGFQVTCYRFTGDPDAKVKIKRKVDGKEAVIETTALEEYSARFRERTGELVEMSHCGRINAQTLRKFDLVLFFTTSTWTPDRGSHPLTAEELQDLIAWVRAGGAIVAVHCGADTLHGTDYGKLVGGVFAGHPWVQKVRVHVEDPKHPAARGFADGAEIFDEIYQFGPSSTDPRVPLTKQTYSRERLHVILSVDPAAIDVTKGSRIDKDYAIAWCQQFGKGRSFYTSLGHHKDVWRDPRFQDHLLGGMKWAVRLLPGDATPSAPVRK
jgi:type 1 glutamine amidotransferase